MKKIISLLVVATVLLTVQFQIYAAVRSNSAASIKLVTANKSSFTIVISKTAPASTRLAAEELQNYIAKTTGAKLAISNRPSGSGKSIFLGNNAALPKKQRFDSDSYKAEKYAIFNWQGNLVIMGGEPNVDPLRSTAGNFGLLYGVYDFIEKYLGTRWYAPGKLGECIDSQATIVVDNLPLTYQPSYSYRTLWPRTTEEATSKASLLWLRRLKAYGSKPNNINHSLDAFSYEHRDSPEIFALDGRGQRIMGKCTVTQRNGKNIYKWTKYPQLCLTSPKLVDLLVKAINGWYANGGERERGTFYRTPHSENYIYLSFADNFGLNPCHGPKCSKIIAQPNGFSNLVWKFTAEVARRLKKDQPGKIVSTLAYNRYAEPPSRKIKIPDNVSVRICVRPPIIYFGAKAYRDKSSKIIQGWSERVSDISFWQYHVNFGGSSIYPVDVPHIIQKFYKRYQGKASSTFFQPGSGHSKSKSTYVIKNLPREIINTTFTLRSLWNPDYDADVELSRFYLLFFGPAADKMKEYYKARLAAWENMTGKTLKSGNAVSGDLSATVIFKQIYPFALVKKLDKQIRAARQQTPAGSIYRQRIDWFIKKLHEPFYKLSEAYFKDNNNRELMLPESPVAPVIDGKLTDKAWQKTEKIAFFNTSGPVAPTYPTSFKAIVKNNILYLAVEAVDPHSDNQRLNAVKQDDAAYFDDSVELFVVPNPKQPKKYYQAVINLNNIIFDAYNDKTRKLSDIKWSSGIRSATKKLKGKWQMELAVPLKNFGIKKFAAETEIGFNICRNKKSGVGENHEASQWVPTSGNFHRTDAFGTLVGGRQPFFVKAFDKTNANYPGARYSHKYKAQNRAGATINKATFKPGNISCIVKDGKLIINATFLPVRDIVDRISFRPAKMTSIPVGDKTRMQIKVKSSIPSIQFLLGYSYEDINGKKCTDYIKIRTAEANEWLVKSFDLRDDGQYAPKRAKTNQRFGIPKTFKGMTIYISGHKFTKNTPFKFEIDYIKLY
ncbi:MAG: DUF4838 domain-containing protein [Victivallaceae bacterium]|nr:DUF4838 domain-containing protein [Victivallaceae bacterium]